MENVIQLTEYQKELIERLGVAHEKGGLQPAPSRVIALLLVSPETELTFDQIRETLNLSKSAASNAINLLLNVEKLEYITKPGDRKRYFRSKINSWNKDVREQFKSFQRAADLMEEILKQRPPSTPEFNGKLADVVGFIRFINNRLPELYQEWQEKEQ